MGDAELRSLLDLLERERDALRHGRVDELAGIEAERAAFGRIGAQGANSSQLQQIRSLAERNCGLAEAAQRGVAAARDRVRSIGDASGPITAYTESGNSIEIGATSGQVERKA